MRTTKTTSKSTTASTYTSKEVAEMLGICVSTLWVYIKRHPEIRPNKVTKGKCNGTRFTAEEVNRIIEFRNKHTTVTATANSVPTTTPANNALITISTNDASSMFDTFINIEQEESANENIIANRKFKSLFESMNERDLQFFFEPLTERFKFAYIVKVVSEIQSQTLTCIKKGSLKGMSEYKLTYSAFLKLCKFAVENNCPLNIPQNKTDNM